MVNKLLAKFLDTDKIVAYDIGAKEGVFNLDNIKEHVQFLGFEPNPEEIKKLQNHKNVTYFPLALADKKGTRQFHITRNPSYSSFLQLDKLNFKKHFGLMKDYETWKAGMQIDRSISLNVDTLDYFSKENKIDQIDFLKLDTQGTELEILKGAKDSLNINKIGVIFSEFSFIKIYKNQNTFSEMDQYLEKFGYECIDCRFYPESVPKTNLLFGKNKLYDQPRYSVGGDAVFVPKIEQSDLGKKTLFKTGIIIAHLGYFSPAQMFLQRSGLSQVEIQDLLKLLNSNNMKKLSREFIPPAIYQLGKKVLKNE